VNWSYPITVISVIPASRSKTSPMGVGVAAGHTTTCTLIGAGDASVVDVS